MRLQSTDQLGNTIHIDFPPQRIISLVPSQTELLFDIGLDEEIVGSTRYCIYPAEKVKDKAKIGGTKKFNIEKIKLLNPDLIIGNKEENYQEGIEQLNSLFPIWMSDIFTLNDSYNMMLEVGRITNRQTQAQQLVGSVKDEFLSLKNAVANLHTTLRCAYFIWRKPYMVAGADTFINHMLKLSGFKNVFDEVARYPEINPETLREINPDYIFLSSEPYSFSEKHFEEFQAFAPGAKVVLADGEMFSWYGSRLKQAPAYIMNLHNKLSLQR